MSDAVDDDALAVHTDGRLDDLPGSAREIATLLALDGPATPTDIAAELDYSYRLVLYRLGQLKLCGLVERRVDPADTRRVLYDISDM